MQLDDGTTLDADVVVDASGRRSPLPRLLGDLGVELAEQVEDTGIVYFSRFFALRDGADYPEQLGPIGGDLDYLKFGVFRGDDRTFSITLAARTDDEQLRRALLDPDRFLAVAARHPRHRRPRRGQERAEPITGVHVMASLLNRRRWFVDADGAAWWRACTPSATRTPAPTRCTGAAAAWRWCRRSCSPTRSTSTATDHTARAVAYEAASRPRSPRGTRPRSRRTAWVGGPTRRPASGADAAADDEVDPPGVRPTAHA